MYFEPELLAHAKILSPNYENPETRGNALTILNSVFLSFAAIFIGLRLYTRMFVRKWFGWDDIFVVLGFASTIVFNAITFVGIDKYGWDRHTYDIPLEMATTSLRLIYFGKLVFLLAGAFITFGLIAFYYRLIAESGTHWFRWALHSLTVFNICYWTAIIIAEIFICSPVQYYWEMSGPPGAKCIDEGPVTLTGGVIKTFIDLWVTTLPLPLVMNTHMIRRQRILVAVLFALGYVVTGAGAARVYYTWKTFFTDGDMSWWQYPTFISSTIENNLAIICACAPTIRPLFPHLFGGPISRVRGWITSVQPNTNSNNSSDPDKRPSSHLPFSSTRRSRRPDSILSLERPDSDLELVIQKNRDDRSPSGNASSDGQGFDFGLEEGVMVKREVRVERSEKVDVLKSQGSTVTVRSSEGDFANPFDAKFDGIGSPGLPPTSPRR